MKKATQLILFLLLFSLAIHVKAEKDSTFNTSNFSFGLDYNSSFVGRVFYSELNIGGLYIPGWGSSAEYETIVSRPKFNFTFGYRSSKNFFHYFSLATGTGEVKYAPRSDYDINLQYTLLRYQLQYQFCMGSKIPVKPFASAILVYTMKDYYFHTYSGYGGGNFSDYVLYTDQSKLYLLQLGGGFTFQVSAFKFFAFLNVDACGVLTGKYSYDHERVDQLVLSKEYLSDNYSLNIHNHKKVDNKPFSLGFRVLFVFDQ